MAGYLNEHGVTSNDLSFFRERRAVGQRWLGVDYYPTCEHRVASTGRCTTSRARAMGFRALATQYHRGTDPALPLRDEPREPARGGVAERAVDMTSSRFERREFRCMGSPGIR